MNSKVFVVADETGSVINVSENSEYGYVRVQQMNLYGGQGLDGKIVIEESLSPFNKKTPERDYKVAGKTGIICTLGGLPIYRRTKFSFNQSAVDTTIDHDNIEQLREAYAAQQVKENVDVNEDFSI